MRAFPLIIFVALRFTVFVAAARGDVSFNRDIRPILSANCFACHGPDAKARKADRRLDTAEGAVAEKDGVRAIVPGDPAKSDLLARITSHDPDEQMPPPKSDRMLSPREIALLRTWIEQGAKWEPHWSLVPPQRPVVPESANANPIDAFIRLRLAAEKLAAAPEASPETLIRRLSYDLTGLPPSVAEIDMFLQDTAPDAYGRLVERLLASPRYGEKMAVHWLDLARYADTHGYHLDSGREQWPWRDWVIAAFNRNLPFDQFVLWQIAGDLLPGATPEQRAATAFVRNNMINFEGGAIAEEYLAAYIKDRVNTVGTAFLGLTVACCECHDHKFDPLTQRDFYQLYAYFNAVPEKGLDGSRGNAAPVMELPAEPGLRERLEEAQRKLAEAEKKLAALTEESDFAQQEWEKAAAAAGGAGLPEAIAKVVNTPREQQTPGQRKKLQAHYRDVVSPILKAPSVELEQLRVAHTELRARIPTLMVMEEMAAPRETHILIRGQYDQPGERVEPGVPAALGVLPPDAPRNRLALARWLIDPQHPLMARVTVNRFWKSIMGTGIVKTVNDFGAQGEWPSHPELLDWLATEFVASGWDVKHLVRLIVTSATYRQSSRFTPELRERDSENRLYARGPRFRLSAEEIRDTALAASGLLNPKIGGASVSPYQPPGLWEELSSRGDSRKWTAQFYEQSHGADLYRRSMYTFWKRTCPPPQMQAFDAPDREVCIVNRERTNTPLQALVTLNDPIYLEAARHLAERTIQLGGGTPAERVAFAFRTVLGRAPSARESNTLSELFTRMKSRYGSQPDEAAKLLATGESPRAAQLDAAEVAAWTVVVSTILNLDEAITKG